MQMATLEHVNITVSNPKETAALLCRIFDWHIRWEGNSMDNGYTVHVGTKTNYIALYSTGSPEKSAERSYLTRAGLNHIALVVDRLDVIEARVRAEGLEPNSHGDYEPGRRFYFTDRDEVEYEVVSYAPQKETAHAKEVMHELGKVSRYGALMK